MTSSTTFQVPVKTPLATSLQAARLLGRKQLATGEVPATGGSFGRNRAAEANSNMCSAWLWALGLSLSEVKQCLKKKKTLGC